MQALAFEIKKKNDEALEFAVIICQQSILIFSDLKNRLLYASLSPDSLAEHERILFFFFK